MRIQADSSTSHVLGVGMVFDQSSSNLPRCPSPSSSRHSSADDIFRVTCLEAFAGSFPGSSGSVNMFGKPLESVGLFVLSADLQVCLNSL